MTDNVRRKIRAMKSWVRLGKRKRDKCWRLLPDYLPASSARIFMRWRRLLRLVSLPAYRPLFGKRIKIAACAAAAFLTLHTPQTAARSFFTRSRVRLRNAKRTLRNNGLRLV